MSQVTDFFLQYVSFETTSSETSDAFPSTEGQRSLGRYLAKQLTAFPGMHVDYDETYGYVYASLPSNLTVSTPGPAVGFLAHMDTSPEVSGKNIKPAIIKSYDSNDIVLSEEKNIVMSPSEFPELTNYKGKDLIVTDGTTLLGADDKAGVAEIMTMLSVLTTHPELPHGDIKVAFTPDEEIGCGTDHFDVERFGAEFAYTIDGGALGELEYENFNAASATLIVHGKSVHPGDAKNKMRNALLMAYEFHSLLPVMENPMYTEGYEGFYHPDHIEGGVEYAKMDYIIRDHDSRKFAEKKERFRKTADFLNEKYGEGTFCVTVKDSYYNMKEQILPHMHLIDNATEAMKELGITPVIRPIRGGTDGARLSFMGLPCPNLGTGGHNFHGRYEYVCIQSMEQTVELLLAIVRRYSAF